MAERQVLILVNGAPGSGKTTLAKKLAKDLQLPALHKDGLKEFLFDTMGIGDLQWSQDLGAAVAEMLFAFSERWLQRGRSAIVESAFFYKFAAPRFAAMLKQSNPLFLELYCKAEHAVRRQRFIDRNERGERHPGHNDGKQYNPPETDADIDAKYAPLTIGTTITVDTTHFDEPEYQALLAQIRQHLAGTKEES